MMAGMHARLTQVCDKGRLRQAAKAIDAQLQRAAGGGPSSSSRGGPPPRHGRDDGGRDRSGRDRDRDRDQRDRARDPPRGGDSEQPLTGTDVVEAYRACLPWWHDFHQRRCGRPPGCWCGPLLGALDAAPCSTNQQAHCTGVEAQATGAAQEARQRQGGAAHGGV